MFNSTPLAPSTHWVYCGLIPIHGEKEDFPLLNARVHYDLVDVQALANLIQTYTSNASYEVEINYVFPLPPDASVCAFKAVIDGSRTIKGVVKEKSIAKAEYEDAVSRGKTAALLEQANVEIFQVSLGNIRPKQTIEIHISYACIISQDGSLDSLRINFPSAIAPRYGVAPGTTHGLSSHVQPWGGASTFSSALDFSLAVQMASQIKSITSPSHPIAMKFGEFTLEPSTEFDPTKARVSLSSPTLLEKDIVVVLSCQGLDRPRCTIESFSPEEGAQEYTDAYALTFVPRFELPSLPSQEYIFLVDRSGSMEGGKMDAVRSALQIMLMSLPARGTSFNIISFGTSYSLLWPSSVQYSAESVKLASSHVDSMSANFGGTSVRIAIEAAFTSRTANNQGPKVPTAVFVLTDGQAFDLDGVQSSVSQAVKKTKMDGGLLRLFCMGIGDAVSKAMCDVIARAGQGTAVFVGESEKPDHQLMGLLRAARGAVVENLSVNWGVPEVDPGEKDDFEVVSSHDAESDRAKYSMPIPLFDESYSTAEEKISLGPDIAPVKLPPPPRIQQAPSIESLPPLYPGFRTNIFAIVRRNHGGNVSPSKMIQIKGSVLGNPVQLEVTVVPVIKTETSSFKLKMLHILAARAIVQTFEDVGEVKIMAKLQKAEVLRIALRYGISSSQTSFVAIDEDSKRTSQIVLLKCEMAAGKLSSPFGGRGGRGGFGGPFGALRVSPDRSTLSSRQAYFGGRPLHDASQPSIPASSIRANMPALVPTTSSFPQRATGVFFGSSSSSTPSSTPLTSTSSLGSGLFGATTASMEPTGEDDEFKPSVRLLGSSGGTSSLFETSAPSSITFGNAPCRGFFNSLPPPPLPFAGFPGPKVLPPTVESFARAQSFDGSFAGTPELFQLLAQQPTAPDMPDTLRTADPTIWCTLLCVAYLETKFEYAKDVWAFIVEKAMAWVKEALVDIGGAAVIEALKDEAKMFLV
ncbi:hypothetical protein K439DRAFT_1415709 [Ramaria rubella]|nr:hypothetical protein K439DRAFT_1415709 [Ramaria rubella]